MTEPNFILRTWQTTPPVTRYISMISVIVTLLVYLKMATVHDLSFSSHYILNHFQLWRAVTPYFYFGKLNIETVLHIIFLARYSRMLEETISSSEYLTLLVYIMVALKTVDYVVYLKLGMCLSSCITYIWTRKNPHTHVQLLGCIVFPAFYLPFVVPMFSMLSEKKIPSEEIVGIVVGHIFYYFRFVWPRFAKDILITPNWLKRIFGEYYEDVTVKLVDRNSAPSNAEDLRVSSNIVLPGEEAVPSDRALEEEADLSSSISVIDEPDISLSDMATHEVMEDDSVSLESYTDLADISDEKIGALLEEPVEDDSSLETFENDLVDKEADEL